MSTFVYGIEIKDDGSEDCTVMDNFSMSAESNMGFDIIHPYALERDRFLGVEIHARDRSGQPIVDDTDRENLKKLIAAVVEHGKQYPGFVWETDFQTAVPVTREVWFF